MNATNTTQARFSHYIGEKPRDSRCVNAGLPGVGAVVYRWEPTGHKDTFGATLGKYVLYRITEVSTIQNSGDGRAFVGVNLERTTAEAENMQDYHVSILFTTNLQAIAVGGDGIELPRWKS